MDIVGKHHKQLISVAYYHVMINPPDIMSDLEFTAKSDGQT